MKTLAKLSKFNRKTFLTLAVFASFSGNAEESSVIEGSKKAEKSAGATTGKAWKATKDAGKKVGQGVKKAGKEVGKATKEGAKEFEDAFNDNK